MNIVQNTQEWLDFRKNKIGASDAPIIMGISPYKTPYQLWREKVGIDNGEEETFAMRRGKNLEEKAREKFEEETGLLVFPKVVTHSEYDWMIASLDGMDIDEKNIVEIKCPCKEDHLLAKQGKVPGKYYPQIQHQLAVTGLEKAFYYSFDGENGVSIEVRRDEEYIQELIDYELDFLKCMEEMEPPKLIDKDFIVHNDEIWNHIALELLECKKQMEALDKKERHLKDTIISMAKNKNAVGGGIKLTKVIKKGPININKLRQTLGVDIEEFRNQPVEYWKVAFDNV